MIDELLNVNGNSFKDRIVRCPGGIDNNEFDLSHRSTGQQREELILGKSSQDRGSFAISLVLRCGSGVLKYRYCLNRFGPYTRPNINIRQSCRRFGNTSRVVSWRGVDARSYTRSKTQLTTYWVCPDCT